MKIVALILIIILLYFFIRSFAMLEMALFGAPEQPQGVTWSSMVFYVAISLGGILGFSLSLYYMLTEGGNMYDLGFSSWGLLGNVVPYLLIVTISMGVALAFARESSLMRRIFRSLFVVFACLLGFAGGFLGSMVVISFLFVWVLGKLFDAITRHKFGTTPSPVAMAEPTSDDSPKQLNPKE